MKLFTGVPPFWPPPQMSTPTPIILDKSQLLVQCMGFDIVHSAYGWVTFVTRTTVVWSNVSLTAVPDFDFVSKVCMSKSRPVVIFWVFLFCRCYCCCYCSYDYVKVELTPIPRFPLLKYKTGNN